MGGRGRARRGLVQGHAIGAGFQLALAADLRIVADDVQLAMRETSLGLVPDLAGTRTLVDLVGYARALEICMTGRFVGATEAVDSGLASMAVAPEDLASLAPLRSVSDDPRPEQGKPGSDHSAVLAEFELAGQ